jgi:hypothetical protein
MNHNYLNLTKTTLVTHVNYSYVENFQGNSPQI